MGFGNILRGAVQAYGRNVIWNKENDQDQANLALKQQQIEANASAQQQQEEQQAARKRIGEQIAAAQKSDIASINDPLKQAATWQKAATDFAAGGDFEAATRAESLAASLTTQARQTTLDLAKQTQMAKEELSSTALDYSSNPTAEGAAAVARAAVAAGENPLDIPKPSTPEFKTWVKTKSLAALSGNERVKHLEGEAEFAAKREDARQRHADLQHDREENRKLRAAIQAGVVEDRRGRRLEGQYRTDFNQSEKLNTTLQAVAKPILEDRLRISELKGLLAVDSSEADQQIRQGLTGLMGHFKSHATMAFYKDNKNFGDVVQRLSGMTSHAFTGRYDEQTRRSLHNMLTKMETGVIDPKLTRLEQGQRAKAEKYGLDPELIMVQGDFNRANAAAGAPGPAAKPGTPATPTGELRRTADGRLLRKNPDGTIEEVK